MTVQHCSQWHYVTIRPSTYHKFFSLWFCSSESEKEPIKVTISDDACFRFILLKILLYRSSMSRVLNCGMILDTIWEWKCGFQTHFRVKPCFVSVWFISSPHFRPFSTGTSRGLTRTQFHLSTTHLQGRPSGLRHLRQKSVFVRLWCEFVMLAKFRIGKTLLS